MHNLACFVSLQCSEAHNQISESAAHLLKLLLALFMECQTHNQRLAIFSIHKLHALPSLILQYKLIRIIVPLAAQPVPNLMLASSTETECTYIAYLSPQEQASMSELTVICNSVPTWDTACDLLTQQSVCHMNLCLTPQSCISQYLCATCGIAQGMCCHDTRSPL